MVSPAGRAASGGQAVGPHPSPTKTDRRWFRRSRSRLARALERNAEWVAEARYTPSLHDQHSH
jgi:hypothetical protein